MQRSELRFPAVLLGAYIILHVSLELHIIHRGIMVPTLWEMLEWILTFPLSIWQFFFGFPESAFAKLVYYGLVVANSFFLGSIIGKLRRGSQTKDDAEQEVTPNR
jgi:hypothetical protein